MRRFSLGICVLFATLAAAQNPVPFITQPLAPAATTPGSATFTLHVSGTNFVSGATVLWNGNALATTFVSSSELSATVPAGNVASLGTATVTVSNPSPGGGTSNAVLFPVRQPAPGFGAVESTLPIEFSRDVVIGDFNGDHIPDAAFTDVLKSQIAVLLGNGDGTFQPPVDYPVINSANNLAMGDVNGDGILDLLGVEYQGTTISVLLGNGDGTFQSAIGVQAGNFIEKVALGDMNQDGKVDIVVTGAEDQPPFDGLVSVVLGNGDGTFKPPADYVVGQEPLGVALGDFNHDGFLDVAVGNRGDGIGQTSTVSVLFGSANGTLSHRTDYTTPAGVGKVLAADFNNDGNLDLMVTAFGNGNELNPGSGVSILIGNADGTFQPQVPIPVYRVPLGGAVADMNGDGNLDFVFAESGFNRLGVITFGLLGVLRGNGDGTFKPDITVLLGADFSGSEVALADLNNDGRVDVLVAGLTNNEHPGGVVFLQGQVQLSSQAVQFGNVVAGRADTLKKQVVLSNASAFPLNIGSIKIQGQDAAQFSQTNNCQAVLPGGGNCTITVTFNPNQVGDFGHATIYIADDAQGQPQMVKISGSAVATIASFGRTTIDFGRVTVGSTGGPVEVFLTNVGQQNLNIFKKGITGHDPSDFAETDNCPATLAPGEACEFEVSFTPSRIGAETADLTVSDDGGQSPQRIKLRGAGK